MNKFNRSIVAITTLFCVPSIICAEDADADGFHPMLNGQDLTGWVLVNTPAETWSFKDGMLVCTGKPIGEIRTEKMYQNFIMEVEWRHLVPKGNAGIFVWADDITAKGQPFHRGIEVQVLENAYGNTRSFTPHGDIFPIHGAKMTPVNGRGGSRAFPTEERAKPSPEWNHYRIECNAGEISLAVNGTVVTQGADCSPSKGYICIESEGGVVNYRNMRIKELPDTPISDEHVATANRNFRSLYSGLNLAGWQTTKEGAASWKSHDWTLSFDGKVSSVRAAALISDEKFDDLQFIIDVKLKDETSSVVIQLPGRTNFDLRAENVRSAFDATNRWNRVEGSVNGGQVLLTVNGKLVHSGTLLSNDLQADSTGSIILIPVGAVDFANIYVRPL